MAQAEGKSLISTGEEEGRALGRGSLSQLSYPYPRRKNFWNAKEIISKVVGGGFEMNNISSIFDLLNIENYATRSSI